MKAEKKPLEVLSEEGWSPYKAKDFLLTEGLETGYYNKLLNEWFAATPLVQFGEGFIQDNVAYYVDGTEKIAKTLKIQLNVNDSSRSTFAKEKLLGLSCALSQASLNQELSESMMNAILNSDDYSEFHGNKKLSIQTEVWAEHKFNGYDTIFMVASI